MPCHGRQLHVYNRFEFSVTQCDRCVLFQEPDLSRHNKMPVHRLCFDVRDITWENGHIITQSTRTINYVKFMSACNSRLITSVRFAQRQELWACDHLNVILWLWVEVLQCVCNIFSKVYFPKYYIHPTGIFKKNWSLKKKTLQKYFMIRGLSRSWMRTNDCTKSSLKYHFTTLSASGYQLESMAHDATINVFWYTASLESIFDQYPYLSWKRYMLKI